MAQRTRYIPRATSYAVEERDNRQCQYPHPDGGICGEKWFIEKDHVLEFALGGAHDDDNLQLLCRAHNQLRAEQRFGKWLGGDKVECFDDFAAHASPAKAAGEQGEGVG